MDIKRFENEMWNMIKLIKGNVSVFFNSFIDEHDLTKIQSMVLFGLKTGEFNTIGGMAEHIMSNQGNTSTICKKMEQQGLIKRTRSLEDERVVIITLTEEGDKKITSLNNSISKKIESISEHVSSEQLEAIIKGFSELDNLFKTINQQKK